MPLVQSAKLTSTGINSSLKLRPGIVACRLYVSTARRSNVQVYASLNVGGGVCTGSSEDL